ncbi:MAG: hypothetical protein PHW04_00855 [Candidatus Wallbacteria bacterium]|nr:hypothetical protein [Candidatus Wallbacteria bacterium]
MWEKIKNLDKRIIYLCVALSVIIPMLNPIGLPIVITEETRRAFQAVDNLPPGSRVLFSADYDPGSEAELFPMNIAILRHCFQKKLRVVMTGLWPQGPAEMNKAFGEIKKDYPTLTYGTDYVNVGYKAGGLVVVNSIGSDFTIAFPKDQAGTDIRELPILQDVKNYSSFGLVISLSAGSSGGVVWVAYGGTKYHVDVITGCTAVSATEFYPYYSSGQFKGLINGLAGAAEYEKMVGAPGKGIRGMDAQSMSHLVIIGFIILGNVIYLTEKYGKK